MEQIKLAIDLDLEHERKSHNWNSLDIKLDEEQRHELVRLMAQAIAAVHNASSEGRSQRGKEDADVERR